MDANLKIEGEKIFLTPMQIEDAEDFVRWRNSDFVMSRFLYREPFTVDNQIAWIKTKVFTEEIIQFVIWDKKDNVKIGSAYLEGLDYKNHKCEYGVLIGERDYLGSGRGTEACHLTTEFAFGKMDMHKVYARVLSDNIASIKAMEKAGFIKDGVFRDDILLDGRYCDITFLSKICEE